jgi:hypothetical protein
VIRQADGGVISDEHSAPAEGGTSGDGSASSDGIVSAERGAR